MTFAELFIAIEERRDIAVEACDKVLHSMSKLDSLDDEIHEMHLLEHRFLHDETARSADHFVKALQEFSDLEYEAARTVEMEKTASIERLRQTHHFFDHEMDHLIETHKQINSKIIKIENALVDYEDLLSDLTHNLSMEFAEYFSHCIDLLHATQDLGDDTETTVGEFSEAVSNDFIQSTFQAFSDLDHSVQEISNKRLPDTSKTFIKNMDESFDRMNTLTDDQGTFMTETIHDMMLHMMDYVERDSLRILQDMFKKLTNEALVSMEKTAQRSLEIVTEGSHTANAIKHWLPALMDVRETTVVVRETMESAIG